MAWNKSGRDLLHDSRLGLEWLKADLHNGAELCGLAVWKSDFLAGDVRVADGCTHGNDDDALHHYLCMANRLDQ